MLELTYYQPAAPGELVAYSPDFLACIQRFVFERHDQVNLNFGELLVKLWTFASELGLGIEFDV